MQVVQGIETSRFSGVVLTIGNFDGVHRGHRALLDAGAALARRAGAQLVVMTFEPHPSAVVSPDRVPPTLTPLHEKLRLLEQAGVGATVVVESRAEFFAASAEDFISKVIVDRFRPVALVEGDNFRFGRHRQGDVGMLKATGSQDGFELRIVEPVRAALGGHPDTVISSSLVRHLLSSGNVDRAASCLGRPYALFGTVCRGAGRGRTLGFPTVNLAVENQLIPAEGVYAGAARLGAENASETSIAAAISIGRMPTFDARELTVEAYLLDFDADLYGRPIRLDLLDWIRDQERFATVDALREQMARDVAHIRQTTANQPK